MSRGVWGGIVVLLLIPLVGLLVAYTATEARLGKVYSPALKDVAVPMPLSPAEVEELRTNLTHRWREAQDATCNGDDACLDALINAEVPDVLAGVDLAAHAAQLAAPRGRALVDSRLNCTSCHSPDLSGTADEGGLWEAGIRAPNITNGGVTAGWTGADWDRAVRHGLRRDGTPLLMPSEAYSNLSDRELSDVIAYIRSLPSAPRVVPASELGPAARIRALLAPVPLAAERIDHQAARAEYPPAPSVGPEYGKHLGEPCLSCHGANLAGGAVPYATVDTPRAPNLTPDPSALGGWSIAEFMRAMKQGKGKDNRDLHPVMPSESYARMTETDLRALFAWLQTVPPVPTAP